MSEKVKSGREPISYIELKQKSCSREWGQLPCIAGLTNLILGSESWLNTLIWDRGNWNILLDQPTVPAQDNWPNDGAIFRKNVSGDNFITADVSYVAGAFDEVWFIFNLYPIDVVIDSVDFRVDTTTGTASASVNPNTAVISNTGGGFENFDEINATDLGNGWVRIEVKLLDSRIGSGNLTFVPLVGGGEPSLNDEIGVGGLTVTNTQTQGYVQTGDDEGDQVIALSDQPCFNTRSTCQDPTNFDLTTTAIKFIDPRSPLPRDDYYIPSMKSAKVSPARLNPAGANRNSSALGKRAVLTAQFNDHPHNDKVVDLYRADRPYDPFERGTFWSKWRSRNPYYIHTFIDYVTGYLLNGSIVEKTTRSFVMTGFEGPNGKGAVTIQAKDILTLVEDDKAQAPTANTGKLSATLAAGATSATLTPAGIGNLEYPASGRIRIEKEVMDFTRSGDNLTLSNRGSLGTEDEEHAEDSVVQWCLEYTSENFSDILYDLLNVYAGIDASLLNKAAWDVEQAAYLPNLYTAIIAEPTGVAQLISEMCQQMYFTVWWDERTSLVEVKALRAAQDEEVTSLNDDAHLLADSITWSDNTDELITQAWVFHGQINPTVKLNQESNYSTVEIVGNFDAEGSDQYDTSKIKKIYSRWIDATNTTAANDLATSVINRYSTVPRSCTFTVDAKDDSLWLSDFIKITNRLNVNQFGQVEPVNLQIMQASEPESGSRVTYAAQQYLLQQEVDPDDINIVIGSDLLNVNLYDLYVSLKGTPAGTETVTFTIRDGVVVGGDTAGGGVNVSTPARTSSNDTYDAGNSSTSGLAVGTVPILQRAGISSQRDILVDATYPSTSFTADWLIKEYPQSIALQTGVWPVGVTLNLIVESGAKLLGEGGNGSAHVFKEANTNGQAGYEEGVPAGDGGHALKIEHPISITNNGLIAGGGGGGSCIAQLNSGPDFVICWTGGGGAGNNNSIVRTFINLGTGFSPDDASGGSDEAGGAGASEPDFDINTNPAFGRGFGGDLAEDGETGNLTGTSDPESIFDAPGVAGAAVESGSNDITWINKGDVRGAENV